MEGEERRGVGGRKRVPNWLGSGCDSYVFCKGRSKWVLYPVSFNAKLVEFSCSQSIVYFMTDWLVLTGSSQSETASCPLQTFPTEGLPRFPAQAARRTNRQDPQTGFTLRPFGGLMVGHMFRGIPVDFKKFN